MEPEITAADLRGQGRVDLFAPNDLIPMRGIDPVPSTQRLCLAINTTHAETLDLHERLCRLEDLAEHPLLATATPPVDTFATYPWLKVDPADGSIGADLAGCTAAESDRRIVIVQELQSGRLVTPPPEGSRNPILAAIARERNAQDVEHGGPVHDDTHTGIEWARMIQGHAERGEEAAFVAGEALTSGREAEARAAWRKQMIRCAALAIAAVESHDRLARRGRQAA